MASSGLRVRLTGRTPDAGGERRVVKTSRARSFVRTRAGLFVRARAPFVGTGAGSFVRTRPALLVRAIAALLAAAAWLPVGDAAAAKLRADIVYATAGDTDLALDLHLPADADAPPPLVVWIHGGAWRAGSKADPPARFAESGFALASVEFRQATAAPFPAMVHDIKAAIRFLRANAQRYGYSAERIAIAGISSGGHLAALVGVTNGVDELEGDVGEHVGVSSDIHAIVVFAGASDLTTVLEQSPPRALAIRGPAVELLLGAPPDETPARARLASPISHVDPRDPPLRQLHGDLDTQMPINQAHQLDGAYKEAGLDAELDVVHGARHGGPAFFDDERWGRTAAFLRRTLIVD